MDFHIYVLFLRWYNYVKSLHFICVNTYTCLNLWVNANLFFTYACTQDLCLLHDIHSCSFCFSIFVNLKSSTLPSHMHGSFFILDSVLINRSALSLILFILSHSLTGIFLLVVVEVLVAGLRWILRQFSLLLKKLRLLELRYTYGVSIRCCLLHLRRTDGWMLLVRRVVRLNAAG